METLGDTGEPLTQANQAHSNYITSLDFSPDGAALATGSKDGTTKLWSTNTWQVDGNPISCHGPASGNEFINCVRYSPSGELTIAIRRNIKIWNPRTIQRELLLIEASRGQTRARRRI
jgi:WD40 repeat protein